MKTPKLFCILFITLFLGNTFAKTSEERKLITQNAEPSTKGPRTIERLLKSKPNFSPELLQQLQLQGNSQTVQQPPRKLSRAQLRKLMLKVKEKNPEVYDKIKDLNVPEQRKLFLGPILKMLGLGSLGKMMAGMGGMLAGGALVAGGAALLGRMNQGNQLKELKRKLMEEQSKLMMSDSQKNTAVSKLNYKIGELQNQLSELTETADSNVNLLNIWVDSHSLI